MKTNCRSQTNVFFHYKLGISLVPCASTEGASRSKPFFLCRCHRKRADCMREGTWNRQWRRPEWSGGGGGGVLDELNRHVLQDVNSSLHPGASLSPLPVTHGEESRQRHPGGGGGPEKGCFFFFKASFASKPQGLLWLAAGPSATRSRLTFMDRAERSGSLRGAAGPQLTLRANDLEWRSWKGSKCQLDICRQCSDTTVWWFCCFRPADLNLSGGAPTVSH